MRTRLVFLAVLITCAVTASAAGPTTRANDDSCDIALLPAATLLLPYFEVDLIDSTSQNTLFTVTNVTAVSRIARVTLWTDHAYPVLTFNIYLTGYDTQSISLFDVIAHGVIGDGNGTGTAKSHVGEFSDPNPQLDVTDCAALPGRIGASSAAQMQEAFTLGTNGACDRLGREHENAVGYATIDGVGNCSPANPLDPAYFTNDIRFDNVLIGDYQQISGRQHYAHVSPMVHIRAIPEGGTPGFRQDHPEMFGNRFPNTFYGRFQRAATNADARQPLPSRFAVRWISDDRQGFGDFTTQFKIWRESATGRNTDCATLGINALIPITDAVTFDGYENGEGMAPSECEPVPCGYPYSALPATVLIDMRSADVFPSAILGTTTSGWLYLNLDDVDPENGAHQSWVVATMYAAGNLSGDMDATALGNGCSPAVALAEQTEQGSVVIGPSENGEP